MSGQNKRINNQISKINKIIENNNLKLIQPIYFEDDEYNNIYDNKSEKYDEVINNISETIGELRGLTMPTSPRTPEKREEYKNTIKELEDLKYDLEEIKKQNR